MSKTVGIAYGWAEGAGHARKLISELRASGFSVTRDLAVADILIAHSGGILILPKRTKAKLILLVGVPYFPGKHPAKSMLDKIRLEFKASDNRRSSLLSKNCLHAIYFLLKPKRHYKIWRQWRLEAYPNNSDVTYIAVRNSDDTFSDADSINLLASNKNWQIVSFGGEHDDLWINPAKYIELINRLLTKE